MFDLIPGAAGLSSEPPDHADIAGLASAVIKDARQSHQRRMLILAGEAEWSRQIAKALMASLAVDDATWVSSESSLQLAGAEVVSGQEVKRLLGQERDVVIFDTHSGFDPDAFGAVSGIIRGGGLLVLLCPPLSQWQKTADPACERIAISPFSYHDISGRFIHRLVKVIRKAKGTCIVEQGKPLPALPLVATPSITPKTTPATTLTAKVSLKDGYAGDPCVTADQHAAVEAIMHVVHGHRRRPAVLVSNRGRGKTTALGIAAARLVQDARSRTDHSKGFLRIVVTAPQRASVDALFFHARRLLEGSQLRENSLMWQGSEIQYIAPDVLSDSAEDADLVLVDEAAAIPASLLNRLLEQYSRIVFATTVHGYEGTGRGFAIRFRQTLDEKTPGWNEVMLSQPVRWAENDPLEQAVFRALLLDADSVPDDVVCEINPQDVVIECVDRDALAEDERTLSQLFGLLVSAHYQTTPNDLRNLLDGPGVSVYVMRTPDKEHVIATALLSKEGEFSDKLADAMFSGKRRPRGHLIPQSLVVHAGIRQAASLRCARIMRIAVHPVLQRKGLGSRMIRFIQSDSGNNGYHLFGTSFGATAELLRFWKAQGMTPVRVGFHRDHSSGEHSVIMLMALGYENSTTNTDVVEQARQRFCRDLPHWLSDTLDDLDPILVLELLRGTNVSPVMADSDQHMLEGFASGARSYEDCSAILWRFTLIVLSVDNQIPGNVRSKVPVADVHVARILVSKVLQKSSWQDVARMAGLSGRNEVITRLRSTVSDWLEHGKSSNGTSKGVTKGESHVGQ